MSSSSSPWTEKPGGGLCPICRKVPAVAQFRPFCSRRCADVDLHRWLSGVYTVPAVEAGEDDDTDNVADAPAAPR